MTEQMITCPNCQTEIPLNEAMTSQIRSQIMDDLAEDIAEKNRRLNKRSAEIEALEKKAKERSSALDKEIEDGIAAERKKLEEKAEEKIRKSFGLKITDLEEKLKEQGSELAEAQKNEIDLRKRERKLEAEKAAVELDVSRKVDAQKLELKREATRQAEEKHLLEKGDLKNEIKGLTAQIDELKRKADQSSQQAQGEVLELHLEQSLAEKFTSDSIKPVPKGVRGADVLQSVRGESGKSVGTIIWESKRTKRWNGKWIDKLKADQRSVKADVAVIVTKSLPDGINAFGVIDGVLVVDPNSFLGVASLVRTQLMRLESIKSANVGKRNKTAMIYEYLSGPEFRSHLEAMGEAFKSMQKDLSQEKAAFQRIWSKREKQIEKMSLSAVGLYGDVQGIIGASIPEIG